MLLSFVLLLCHSQGFITKTDHKSNKYLGPSHTCPLYVFDRDMEVHVNMRRGVTVGLVREIVVTTRRILNVVNSFIKMFLRAGEFIRNQEVLNVLLASPWS